MNPPAGVDMSLIQEALARRQGAQGGTGMPMQQQLTPGAPIQQAPPVAPTGPLPQQQQPQQAQAPQQAQGQPQGGQRSPQQQPQFDDETKSVAKALVTRLLKLW